jgi:hypothetical protein
MSELKLRPANKAYCLTDTELKATGNETSLVGAGIPLLATVEAKRDAGATGFDHLIPCFDRDR